MGLLDRLRGKATDSSAGRVPIATCDACGSTIDHFGITAQDWNVTKSVAVRGGRGNENDFTAMMRRAGGRCVQCQHVSCAQCYSEHNRACPSCGAKIPDFQ